MTIRLGILGFAHGHIDAYCRSWRETETLGVRLCAAWDHDSTRLQDAVEQYGVTPCTSVAALLQGDVDAVIIAAETSMHADLTVQAAQAGKAIILQKPMALTLPEADRIVDAVDRAGVPFTMAWQMRFDPENLRMRELIEGGEFGRILQVRRRHCLPVLLNESFHTSWHLDPEHNRDIFADDAAHAVDFIYWLFGMPHSVTAEMATLFDPRFENDIAVALFRYPDGKIVEVSGCFAATAGENTTEITAEHGVIIQNYGDSPSTSHKPPAAISVKWFMQGDDAWSVSPLPGVSGQGQRIAGLARPLAEFLNGTRPPLATAKEGRDVLRMVLACYVASGEGRRVSMDDPRIQEV